MFEDDDYGNLDDFQERGAIFMSNRATKRECFERELFGLPSSYASFVKHIKSGTILFLFEYERRELHGVYMACSDGAIDIVPHAFSSSMKRFPAQVRFNEIWRCSPLSEHEFRDAIKDNYWSPKKFKFGLNEDQVQRLLSLFRLRKLEDQSPDEGFSYGRLECPIGHNTTLSHKYASPNNLVEEHGAGDMPCVSDEYMGASYDRARQSFNDGKFQDMMEDDFMVENDPVVWNDNLNDISDRARTSPLISGKLMGASFDGVRRSSHDGKFMPHAMMEDEFRVENDPVALVWKNNLDDISGRDRRLAGDSIFLPGDSVGYLPNVQRDLPPFGGEVSQLHLNGERSDLNKFLSWNRIENSSNAWNDVGSANSFHYPGLLRSGFYPDKSTSVSDDMVCDLHKPTNYPFVEPKISDINYAISQAASISISTLHSDANAWNDVKPANSYLGFGLSRSGVHSSLYSDKSTPEADNMVSDKLKLTHYHSIEPRAFESNQAIYQEAPVSISSLPYGATVPRLNYNSNAMTGFNCNTDLVSERNLVDINTDFANRNTLPGQDLYEYSRSLGGIPKLPDVYTNTGKEKISDNERWTHLSDIKFTSAGMQLESKFSGKENSGQAFFSVKSDGNIPLAYPVGTQGGFDNIFLRSVENEVMNDDNLMPIDSHSCPQYFDYAEVQGNSYNYKDSSALHVDESNQIAKRIYSGNHKKRSTALSRLALSSKVDVQETGSHHFGDGNDVDTHAGETMAILPRSHEKLMKAAPAEKYIDAELHINRNHKCKSMLKRVTPKTVSKKCKLYTVGNVEERNRNHDIEKKLSTESKQVSENVNNAPLDAVFVIGDHAAPFINFKRRSKVPEVQDMTERRDCGKSDVLLSGQNKKRTLIRPKFDIDTSSDREIFGKTSKELMLSSQKPSVENDTSGNNCERSKVVLGWQNGGRKLKRPTFGKKETCNYRGINANTSKKLLLPSQKGSLENETSVSQGFIGAQFDNDIDLTYGCTDKTMNDMEPSSVTVGKSTVEVTLPDCPEVPKNLRSSTGEGLIKDSKVNSFQDVPSSIAIKYENRKLANESEEIVSMTYKHTQGSLQDSTQEKHIEDAANDTSHVKSNCKNGKNDVSVEHAENHNDDSVEHVNNHNDEICGGAGNNVTANSPCHCLTLDSDKDIQALDDDEELLQLSLETGSTYKRSSNQILKSLIPSEKQAPFDKDEGFLQLSLGRRRLATFDAANCSNMQDSSADVRDGNRQVRLARLGGINCGMGLNLDHDSKKEADESFVGSP